MQNAEESKEKEQKKAQENRSKNYKAINDQQLSIIIGNIKNLVSEIQNQEENKLMQQQQQESLVQIEQSNIKETQQQDCCHLNDDVVSENNFFQLLEMNLEWKGSEGGENQTAGGVGGANDDRLMRKQMSGGAFSESTEDIMEHFSSANFHDLNSPQASTNTKIELDIKKQNLYSSDAGDSSMQFQNQFSDYNLKDLSNKNEIYLSSVKKHSIDSQDMHFSFQEQHHQINNNIESLKLHQTNNHNQIKIKDNFNKNNQQHSQNQLSHNLIINQQNQQNKLQAQLEQQDETSAPKQLEIIRSSKKFNQEQQNFNNTNNNTNLGYSSNSNTGVNKNQRKKKKKRNANGNGNNNAYGQKGGKSNINDCSNKMNEFMRNMVQYNEDEEEDYCDQDYVYLKKDQQQKGQSQVNTLISKSNTKQIDSMSKYVVKNSGTNIMFGTNLEEIKEQEQYSTFQFQSLNSQITDNALYNSNNNNLILNRFDSFINQKDEPFAGGDPNSYSDLNKKKRSNNKGKKQGWDQKNKKKLTKNPKLNQHQFTKQNSQSQQIHSPLSLTLGRQASQYEMDYESQIQSLNHFNLDYNMLKEVLKQEAIQQSILNAQQKQNAYFQQQQQYQLQLQNSDQQVIDNEYFDQQDNITEYFEMLNEQMLKFQKENEKKLDSVLKEREQAIKIICGLVEQYYRDRPYSVKVKTYGSMASNLAIDTSDVDLAVVGLNFMGNREEQIREMRNIYQQIDFLIQSKASLKFIETATVPVIKLQIDLLKLSQQIERQEKNVYGYSIPLKNRIDESMRYLGIDITFEDNVKSQNYNIEGVSRISLGLDCINYIKEKCMKQHGLKPIVLILKKLLQNYNLNQTYSGGLNSYSLVLMTSAFLSQYEEVQYMSMNLMEFFNYYGNYFDPKVTIITNERAPYFVKSEIILDDNILIVDPLNELNNTARGAFQINKIKEIFREAHKFIDQCLTQFKLDQQKVDVIQLLLNNQNINQSIHQF